MTLTDNLLRWSVQLLLILTRVSAMFVLSPILGRQNIPNMLKVGFSLLVAFIMLSIYPPAMQYPFLSAPGLMLAIASELLVGLIVGFITMLFFALVNVAGHIIDMQIGFAMAEMYDASANTRMPISASLLNVVMIQCFLAAGGLSRLFGVVMRSFDYIPVGGAVFPATLAGVALGTFAKCFVLSLNVAMPLIASAMLAEIGLGIIVRTAPQMNVFVIGIPIKVIIGLVMLLLLTPVFVMATGSIFDMMYEAIDDVVGGMMPI